MDIKPIIDQLAFGSSTPKEARCLGMYISPETIYIAQSNFQKGRATVDHLVRIPVPASMLPAEAKDGKSPPTTNLSFDFFADTAKVTALIESSLSQVSWKTKNVSVTLSHHFGILRYFTMPFMDRRFWKSAAPLEAKKYIPLSFETLVHDFQVMPIAPDASHRLRQGVLFAVTQKDNLARVTDILTGLKLKLMSMEVAPCSVLRLWEHLAEGKQGKAYCQVHFDGGDIRIMLIDNGIPVFFREVFLGHKISLQEQRKLDLGGCVAFAQKQLGVGALDEVRVSGDANPPEQWRQAFSQELGIKASIYEANKLLSLKSGDWGGYAAIGSSLKFSGHSQLTLDLGSIYKASEEEKRTARAIFSLAGIGSLLIALLGLAHFVNYNFQARELARYHRDPVIEAAIGDKTPDEIAAFLKEMESQADELQGIGHPAASVSAIIKDIADNIPDKAWITDLALENPVMRPNQAQASGSLLRLDLVGHCAAEDISQEQDLAYQFKDKLSHAKVIGPIFRDVQITVQTKPGSTAINSQGLNPGDLAAKLEGRTSFTIAAKGGKS